MIIRKAERKQAKLRIGLFGPSGSGKTMSALKLAAGLTSWEKTLIIDTENGSADLYSHLGPYNVIHLEPPFSPERYIEAIKAAEDAGMEVIIVDSISHEWSGVGGVLEIADQLSASSKNSFTVWTKLTPRHNRFIDSIVQSTINVICCGRSKQDYVLNQVEKNGKTITVPEKVGMKAITREGFEYEMTVAFDLAINNFASTSKDRTGNFKGKPEFLISEETGKFLKEWNESGVPDKKFLKEKIMHNLKRLGQEVKTKEQIMTAVSTITGLELIEENFDEIIARLEQLPKEEELPIIEVNENLNPAPFNAVETRPAPGESLDGDEIDWTKDFPIEPPKEDGPMARAMNKINAEKEKDKQGSLIDNKSTAYVNR